MDHGTLSRAVRARISQTQQQREQVRHAFQSRWRLDAEPDLERRIRRMQAVTGCKVSDARALATYARPETIGLVGEQLRGAERIQGKTQDFVGIAFVELARTAANAVARVVFRDGRPQGSGFMVSNRLFLTNNHVIGSASEAARFLLEFGYELNPDGTPRPVTRFTLDPDTFFTTDEQDDLDFTLIAVGPRVSGNADLQRFLFSPLIATGDKHVLGEFVNVIEHPQGDFKQVVLRENQLVARLKTVLHYTADTEPGASGSPVYNDQWEVVALHHWGEPHRQTDGQAVDADVNEGIRVSAIVEALRELQPRLRAPASKLLDEALAEPRRPTMPSAASPADSETSTTLGRSRPREDSTMPQIRIPLEIVINVGAAGSTPAVTAVTGSLSPGGDGLAAEKVTIDPDYANRNGYNPRFLDGFPVPLPGLSPQMRQRAARLRNPLPGADRNELKYQHFSIIMRADRRIAYFTAVNINGATWKEIDRATGESAESAEAAETWYQDPRIDEDAQSDQTLYGRQRPAHVFDRGHLVRRQDPTWGTLARARRANADTFHFTNCSPQQANFNQSARHWQGIENYLLDNAKAEGERVTVFTGPVMADDDPQYRGLQVPMAYWKILVRVENGQLLATALLAEQSHLIKMMPERMSESMAETFDDMGAVVQYQTTVRDIEVLTGLDFGILRGHDSHPPVNGEAAERRRRVGSFQSIMLSPRGGPAPPQEQAPARAGGRIAEALARGRKAPARNAR